jgi:hypothetical protein
MQHGFVGCEVETKKRVVAIPDTVITIASESSGKRSWRPLLLHETGSLRRTARTAAHCSLGRI